MLLLLHICSNHVHHMLQTNRTKLQNMFNKCCKTFRPVLQSMFNKCCKTFRPVLHSMFNKCCNTFRPMLQSMFNKCCKTFRPLRAMMQQWMLKDTSKEISNMHTANHPCSRHCKAFHTHPTLPWELCSSLVLCSTDFKFFAEPEPCSTYMGEVRVLHEIDLCLRQSLKHVWEATTTWNMKLMHGIYFPPEVTSCLTSWSNQRFIEI